MSGLGGVDALFDQARTERPFSNADQGEAWMARWCGRCVHDRPARQMTGAGCPLVLVAVMGRTPAQWLTPNGDGELHCVEFRGEDDGPGPEPQPVPDPPGQLALWPRERFEGVRLLAQPRSQLAPV